MHNLIVAPPQKRQKFIDSLAEANAKVLQREQKEINLMQDLLEAWPDNSTHAEHLSMILENTALIADLVVRWPRVMIGCDSTGFFVIFSYIRKRNDYNLLLKWAFAFCVQRSRFMDGKSKEVVLIAAILLEFERRPDSFTNPYDTGGGFGSFQ